MKIAVPTETQTHVKDRQTEVHKDCREITHTTTKHNGNEEKKSASACKRTRPCTKQTGVLYTSMSGTAPKMVHTDTE